MILTDFFRHAFDGSGADNFFDAVRSCACLRACLRCVRMFACLHVLTHVFLCAGVVH
jgi:hypothetical protein